MKTEQPQMLQPGMYAEDLPDPLPFEGIDKSTVVQETKIFQSSNINSKKCLHTLVKLLYLAGQGEILSATEATDIFFATTKLFQSDNQDLRRQVYILMKELAVSAEQMFIATATLCKDITSKNDMYRANAIRTLRKITEVSMLGPGERYLKQGVVDRNPNVASAALVTGIHLMKDAPEMVKKWSTEVGEALKQPKRMVQYHALGLLQKLKKNNKSFVTKLVQSVHTTPIRSCFALCLLVRMSAELLHEDFSTSSDLYKFIESSLRHTSEMVVIEAAKAICSFRSLQQKDLKQVVTILQLYLSFRKPVLKFASLRLLNKLASIQPQSVSGCSIDMETLFADPNRNIATLAITTMLMTGNEVSIDRLMKQISKFLSDIADEFKAVVTESMKILAKKFPNKHHLLLQFLGNALKDHEGGFAYKMSIVDTISNLVETSPTAKEKGLMTLCELIEDCDFNKISQRVLALLGKEGPSNPNPSKFVRYIYNRVVLEVPAVRAAAVSALAKFAARCGDLRASIIILLKRAAMDNDNEVRDRAVFYVTLLEMGDEDAIKMFIYDVEDDVKNAVPSVEAPPQEHVGYGGGLSALITEEEQVNRWAQELEKIPQFKKLGKPFSSSEPMALTDKDSEYVVTCIKHCYTNHMVLHFRVKNTLEDQFFHMVQVKVDLASDEDLSTMEPEFAIPAKRIDALSEESCFVMLKRDPDGGYPVGSCMAVLSLALDTEDDDCDEYQLPEELVFNLSDYMKGKPVVDFAEAWEAAGEMSEDAYELDTMKSLQEAVTGIMDFYTFTPCEGGDKIEPGKLSHTLCLSGEVCFDPPFEILIKAKIQLTQQGTVSLVLQIKGAYEEMRQLLSESLTS
ncbi:Coatomer subunit gamma-2 [Diplonema papillatum]|nr:Coatomer subunit gamma-2 [Diplonema papillatum]